MGAILLEKEVPVRQVLSISREAAEAIGDPVRAAILTMLAGRPMSVEEIAKGLAAGGFRKAVTTVRHHVDMLKDAGLIELSSLVNEKGGTLKYYAATTRIHWAETPPDFDEKLSEAVSEARAQLKAVAGSLLRNHSSEIREMAEKLKPCPYCETKHFAEYVVIQVLQRGITSLVQDKEFQSFINKMKTSKRRDG